MTSLEQEIKALLIEALNLEDYTEDQIDNNMPLFGDGLGLDSIDALELGLALKKRFNVSIKAEDEETKKHFYSISSLAQFVAENRS